jgi:hypothetical protein
MKEKRNMQNQNSHLAPASVRACKTGKQRVLLNTRTEMRRAIGYFVILYLGYASVLWAVPPFTNLDFEAANVSDLPLNQFEFVPITDGLPGWSAYIGTNLLTQVSHNAITLGAANVGIWGPQYSFGIQPLQGVYTAILQPGDFNNQASSASIAQTGLIPAWASSLNFEAALAYTNDLSVTVGGQSVPVLPFGSGSFGCDVSSFAGSVAEIKFTIADTHGNDLNGLDAITFSPQSIPEPSSLSLLVIGVVALGCWRVTYRKTA